MLPAVFGDLAAPPAVVAEFGRRPSWLSEIAVAHSPQVVLLRELRYGAGEAEALAVAIERPGTVLLLDEKRARAFAARRGIEVAGTAGVVLRAKRVGAVVAVRPILDALTDSGFRLSEDLRRRVLANAGESSGR